MARDQPRVCVCLCVCVTQSWGWWRAVAQQKRQTSRRRDAPALARLLTLLRVPFLPSHQTLTKEQKDELASAEKTLVWLQARACGGGRCSAGRRAPPGCAAAVAATRQQSPHCRTAVHRPSRPRLQAGWQGHPVW